MSKGQTIVGVTVSIQTADQVTAWKKKHKETTPTLAAKIGVRPECLRKALDGTSRLNPDAYKKLIDVISTEIGITQTMFPKKTLEELPPNWNGEGALQPSQKEISVAEQIHMSLPNGVNWQVVPMVNGGVQIEAHEGGMDVEIIVQESTRK